jgi:hypothetical protein
MKIFSNHADTSLPFNTNKADRNKRPRIKQPLQQLGFLHFLRMAAKKLVDTI